MGVITFVIFRSRGAKAKVLARPKYADEGSAYKSPYESGLHWTCDRTAVNKPRFAEKGLASATGIPGKLQYIFMHYVSVSATTLPRLLQDTAKKSGSKNAMRIERPTPPFDSKYVLMRCCDNVKWLL